ncbi:hypothetical protein [Bernardetia sp. MNP-M8]|uniref:hypothetical protein n=1 Tax=Bernardetia sp. MNP-M8 TaxID=3127470 RepID=UPI0030D3EE39
MLEEAEYLLFGCEALQWKIAKNSPKLYKLKSHKYLSFINPLYVNYEELNDRHFFSDSSEKNDFYFVTTNVIVFKVEKGINLKPQDLSDYFDKIILSVREVSKQTTFKPKCSSIHGLKNLNLEISNCNKINGIAYMREYIYSTLITMEMFFEADNKVAKGIKTPIYTEILVDGLEDLLNEKYRKAILYSAMAMEIALATKLDEDYKSKVNEKNYIINSVITKDGRVEKDYLYEHLTNMNSFKILLRERSLYVWNKSIATDKQILYEAAMRLYTTRNKIAHLGRPDNLNKQINIDKKGANEAFEIAKNVFEWLGICEFKHVSISDKFIDY